MAFTKPTVALNLPRLHGGKHRYTDTMDILAAGVTIGYKARPSGTTYPTTAMKDAVRKAAIQARNIVRIANDEMAKVVILRQKESAVFTETMKTHFTLVAGDTAGGMLKDNVVNKKFSFGAVFEKDRRWVLEKIRQMMLSLSFHLNTGIYVIDMDTANRTVEGGNKINKGDADEADGYVTQHVTGGCLCGFRNGEIHIDFNDFPKYTLNSCARIIVHEAAHKYLGVDDKGYAYEGTYPPSLAQALDNADSIAWAAVSLATGAVRMKPGSNDFNNCPGAAL
jgi:hypothetical protein